MVDTCRIERPSGLVTDPLTGVVSPAYTTVYTGKCKVQSAAVQSASPVAGEHKWTVQQSAVHVPVSAAGVRVDDRVVIVTSLNDAQLVGRVFTVRELLHKSFATAQRVSVEEVVA